jgi:hypothetical protein
VATRLCGLVKKIPLIHRLRLFSTQKISAPVSRLGAVLAQIFVWIFRPDSNYSILFFAMTKRKPAKFSVSKAVKANARERVGQPKPSRIVEDQPRTGRESKHKPKLEDMIRREE